MNISQFFDKGWCRFNYDKMLTRWISHALPDARKMVSAEQNAKWLRCGGNWFAGVNVLPNLTDGAVGASGPIQGR